MNNASDRLGRRIGHKPNPRQILVSASSVRLHATRAPRHASSTPSSFEADPNHSTLSAEQSREDDAESLLAYLTKHSVAAGPDVLRIRTTAEHASLREHIEKGQYDWLVMGAYPHPMWMELIFGSVTQSILLLSTIPVLVTRYRGESMNVNGPAQTSIFRALWGRLKEQPLSREARRHALLGFLPSMS
ncbi:nucleotide-binding universal stress UspA family protein [Paraburkholderia bannensis]|uniref:Nucleotide-binding universal stress UspA family protein n=1 Tax=Paraburkholderia bannensis TaxID=765414 RepID=A0A7W9WVA1_9BURK|nr:nucleotide-binding universal stress UspA family protein [Paraburkholderia sp. WP4_3_2]MBB6107265.1 nucleotide-binding universal stress UspA family protein [Paraburkholderia bannensis]